MRKKILLLILVVPLFTIAQQPRGGGSWKGMDKRKSKDTFKGNISGKVIDKDSRKGLEYATVTLVNTRWEKVIEGTITDAKGRFNIKNIPTGKYEIKISFIGYNESSNTFELTKRKPDIKIDDIELSATEFLMIT